MKALPPGPIRSESAFHDAFACSAPSGIDFRTKELRVVSRPLSPAGAGTEVVDDGKTITFVARMRSPCPNEPPPMPISLPVAFTVGTNAARDTADTTCNVSVPCR
jgi:hypothetical protein